MDAESDSRIVFLTKNFDKRAKVAQLSFTGFKKIEMVYNPIHFNTDDVRRFNFGK